MIQLNILSGKKAGAQLVARHFPFRIGRTAGNDLQLEDDGVWGSHLTLALQNPGGITLAVAANALVTVNGRDVRSATLRNGDLLNVGSAKIQFWLAPARQHGLRLREGFVWALLAFIAAVQFALIYWLIR
jgi:pSer/pThr/pTyr-binding forkhead associated (FHA) protein